MPQFDKITFLTQIFWLFFLFIVLYLDFLKNFLSEISVILKIRKKKIVVDSNLVETLKAKSISVSTARKSFFFNFIENTKNSIVDVNEISQNWLNDSIFALNNKRLKQSHSSFMSNYFLITK